MPSYIYYPTRNFTDRLNKIKRRDPLGHSRIHGVISRLLENPVLIEQEDFSETLLAIFHLADELGSRPSFDDLPETDLKHLTGDMNRAYQRLVEQWIIYLEHLKNQYPYLFSLAIRKNPFDSDADSVVVH